MRAIVIPNAQGAHRWTSSWALQVVLCACLSLAACLPIESGSGDKPASAPAGAAPKVEDAFAAAMSLVSTAQLASLLQTEANPGDETADVVAARIRNAVQAGACVQVSGSGPTIVLDFGTGCALPGGAMALVGKATATVKIVGSGATAQIVLDVVLDAFGSGTRTASGGATLTATRDAAGLTMDIAAAMTNGEAGLSGGVHVDLVFPIGGVGGKSVIRTLPLTTITSGSAKMAVEATDVTLARGDCYPSAGSILVTSAGIKATLAFLHTTATSGVAQFTPPLSKKAEDKQLPGLGWKCK